MNISHIPNDNHARFTKMQHADPLRYDWNREDAPPKGERVYVLAEDDRGEYAIPFLVIFTSDGAMNATTQEMLDGDFDIVGWRV